MLDLLIRGGLLVDGTGAPPLSADLGVIGDRIEAIGHLEAALAATVLDVRGYIVAPGFIDIHSHSDFSLLADPRAVSSVSQGVTTEVVGNCGHGCALVSDPAAAKTYVYG